MKPGSESSYERTKYYPVMSLTKIVHRAAISRAISKSPSESFTNACLDVFDDAEIKSIQLYATSIKRYRETNDDRWLDVATELHPGTIQISLQLALIAGIKK